MQNVNLSTNLNFSRSKKLIFNRNADSKQLNFYLYNFLSITHVTMQNFDQTSNFKEFSTYN